MVVQWYLLPITSSLVKLFRSSGFTRHAPSSKSSLSSRRHIIHIFQGLTPLPQCACSKRQGSKLHVASTVSNDTYFRGRNLALRLRDDPPILQLPRHDPPGQDVI